VQLRGLALRYCRQARHACSLISCCQSHDRLIIRHWAHSSAAITQPLAFSPQNSEKSRLSRSSASPAGGPCASTNPLSGLQAHPQPELDHLSRMIWDEICMATHVISFHDGQWGRLLGRLTSYIWHIRITAQKICAIFEISAWSFSRRLTT